MRRWRFTDRTGPLLIAVSDIARLNMPIDHWAGELFSGGVDLVQIREPGLTDYQIREIVLRVIDRAPDPGRVQLNNRLELARSLGCGVHLPEQAADDISGFSPASKAVHDAAAARELRGYDFLVAGHIFETPSHAGEPGRGLNWLNDITRATDEPVIAIGGIDATNAPSCLVSGAAGVAVIRALTVSNDPRDAAERLRHALDNAAHHLESVLDSTSIDIVLNGKPVERPAGSTIQDLLAERELIDRLVVVEVNGAIIARSAFADTIFQSGDVVELVHFVGGG
jgi:thiamine-phosphate pyrophosphorylase